VEKKNNLLADGIDALKIAWRHRKGNEIPATILDTIDILYPPDKPRILPIRKGIKKTQTGWHMIFTMRPGTNFSTLKNQQEYFEDATGLNVEMTKKGKYLHMNINTNEIPNKLEYSWDYSGKLDLPIPVGISKQGLEVLPLEESPHLLVAGVPGYGKSNFLHVLIASLLPVARIGIIDLKRLEFAYLKDYAALAKTEEDALLLMQSIEKGMEQRIRTLEKAGVVKIQDYNKTAKEPLPFIVVVIDELAEISCKDTIKLVDRITRLARAVGISVVAATQRPSTKVLPGDTRAMFQARLCFQVADELNSRMVLGENCSIAAHLPGIKGRAIYRFGMDTKEVQTMHLPVKQAKNLLKGRDMDVFTEWCNVSQKTRLLPR